MAKDSFQQDSQRMIPSLQMSPCPCKHCVRRNRAFSTPVIRWSHWDRRGDASETGMQSSIGWEFPGLQPRVRGHSRKLGCRHPPGTTIISELSYQIFLYCTCQDFPEGPLWAENTPWKSFHQIVSGRLLVNLQCNYVTVHLRTLSK